MVDSAIVSSYSVIPALEQVSLAIALNVTNLYQEDLTNASLRIFVASGKCLSRFLPCYRSTYFHGKALMWFLPQHSAL